MFQVHFVGKGMSVGKNLEIKDIFTIKTMSFKKIDGGMGTYIRDMGYPICNKIWSAHYVIHHPEAVKHAHIDFVKAGCQYITTCNYACTPYYQSKKYFNINDTIRRSGEIAYSVQKLYPQIKILGSLPPYSESYRYDLLPNDNEIANFYRSTISILKPFVNIFIAETLSSLREAKIISDISKELGLESIWYSFSLAQPNSLRDGTDLKQVPDWIIQHGGKALLLNCTPIFTIEKALNYLEFLDKRLEWGIYPNRHSRVLDKDFVLESDLNLAPQSYLDLSPKLYNEIINKWISKYNLNIIGGCCGIHPEHLNNI